MSSSSPAMTHTHHITDDSSRVVDSAQSFPVIVRMGRDFFIFSKLLSKNAIPSVIRYDCDFELEDSVQSPMDSNERLERGDFGPSASRFCEARFARDVAWISAGIGPEVFHHNGVH